MFNFLPYFLSLLCMILLCFCFASEICSVANGASKKEIGRAKEFIVKQLEVEMGQSMEMGTIHAGDFLVFGTISLLLRLLYRLPQISFIHGLLL